MLRSLILLVVLLTLASSAGSVAAGQVPDDAGVLPEDELPVSLARIQRRLDRIARADREHSLLRLSSYVEVIARLPQIDLIRPTFDLQTGPIPYGAPTHAEMIAAMTPRQWRPPLVRLDGFVGLTMKSLNAPR